MKTRAILVTTLTEFENHISSGGEKILGNRGSIKKLPDGRTYDNGGKQGHVMLSAIETLNNIDKETNKNNKTFVSNSDGVTTQIENDLRSDMNGFLNTTDGDYSNIRFSNIPRTPSVSVEESVIYSDLITRAHGETKDESKKAALVVNEISLRDIRHASFFIVAENFGICKTHTYKGGFNVSSDFHKLVDDVERKRRVRLCLEATSKMQDYANQTRNAIVGDPIAVIIVFDCRLNRRASKFFVSTKKMQKAIIDELNDRNVEYFVGIDSDYPKYYNEVLGEDKITTVYQAYKAAFKHLEKNDINDLTNGGKVKTYKEVYG